MGWQSTRTQRGSNASPVAAHSSVVVFAAGAGVGLLGGLGGAEFRLPLLIGIFGCCQRSLLHRWPSMWQVESDVEHAVKARLSDTGVEGGADGFTHIKVTVVAPLRTYRSSSQEQTAPGRVADERVSALELDLADPPGLVEEGLQRAVQAQDDEEALVRVGLDPVPLGHSLGLLRAEDDDG
jgi:hypothetical protein